MATLLTTATQKLKDGLGRLAIQALQKPKTSAGCINALRAAAASIRSVEACKTVSNPRDRKQCILGERDLAYDAQSRVRKACRISKKKR